jgi:hypothetical protein
MVFVFHFIDVKIPEMVVWLACVFRNVVDHLVSWLMIVYSVYTFSILWLCLI